MHRFIENNDDSAATGVPLKREVEFENRVGRWTHLSSKGLDVLGILVAKSTCERTNTSEFCIRTARGTINRAATEQIRDMHITHVDTCVNRVTEAEKRF